MIYFSYLLCLSFKIIHIQQSTDGKLRSIKYMIELIFDILHRYKLSKN